MIIRKYHYVYEITYLNGMKYLGVRSCDCEIEDDDYTGSSNYIPDEFRYNGVKTILSTHSTREQAFTEEIRLHAKLNVRDNPDYYNQCNSTSTKFYPSRESHLRGAEKRRGRTKHTHSYIKRQVQSRQNYVGNNRTDAQKAQFDPERMPERIKKYQTTLSKTMEDPVRKAAILEARVRGGKWGTGIKNPKKAVIGIKHGRVKPWWYKMPNGEVVEVYDSIRNYHQNNSEVLPFTLYQIGAYLREGTAKKTLDLGWDFGMLTGTE